MICADLLKAERGTVNDIGKKEGDEEKSDEEKGHEEESHGKEVAGVNEEEKENGEPQKSASEELAEGACYDDLQEDREFHSETLSKNTRTAFVGLIAALWILLSSDKIALMPTGYMFPSLSHLIIAPFAFAVLAIVCEFAQYLTAYMWNSAGMDRIDGGLASEPIRYDEEGLGKNGFALWRWSLRLFYMKIAFAGAAGISFVVLCSRIEFI